MGEETAVWDERKIEKCAQKNSPAWAVQKYHGIREAQVNFLCQNYALFGGACVVNDF